ncbi:unnamed protein product [Prorocentrum cordatum]|uniref:Uncharacterized protein n=1 Tax=Prorocentrum cordatum TaxID=2364126 RepID=A0ABN9Q9G2_9DINO|nr:unnamed protein product [Polarella glacialis]
MPAPTVHRFVATCRSKRAAAAVVLSSLCSTARATNIGAAKGAHASQAREDSGCSDVFMMQTSAGLSHELSHGSAPVRRTATPAPTCVDSNLGATNRMGEDCSVYQHDPAEPFSGICFDPYYDDDDFTSSMCCVCPAECPALPELPQHSLPNASECEDWVAFDPSNDDGFGRASHSNLGGLGPQHGKPKELRYYSVGKLSDGTAIDMVVTNTSSYIPRNTNWNKIENKFALINLLIGESVKLNAEFVRSHTFCPEVPVLPKITFCDLDRYEPGQKEVLVLDGISALYTVGDDIDFTLELFEHASLASGSPVPMTTYATSSVQTSIVGRTSKKYTHSSVGRFGMKATSEMLGHGCDNPTDPNALSNITCDGITVDQAKRCFMVELSGTSQFSIGFEVLSDQPPGYVHTWGRNFAMAGTSSFFADVDSQPCTIAPTPSPTPPTPSPTPAPTPPTPSPTSSPTEVRVSASGDPHLVNVHGQRFDVLQPGTHVLLHVPLGAHPSHVLLRVEAEAQQLGGSCEDTYFVAVNITGRWAGPEALAHGTGEGRRGLVFRAGGDAAARPDAAWMSFGTVSLKVVHGRTRAGVAYLNLYARNLLKAGYLIGGLLGEGDHTEVAAPNPSCKRVVSLLHVEGPK